ncbi:Ger(x)C family spore germination protein [Bacillus salitolerans]|uniref:Ger(X)C family spore germination protein n=1 Tax=Bacillus salitolerans TaxID=1437434 RepID=A0ABW4LUY0_9BACI
MRKLCFFVIITLVLSGCVQKKIIDDINIISVQGYDTHEDEDTVRGTFVIPVYEGDKSISNTSFSAVASQSKAVKRKVEQKSSDPMVSGSVEVVLFGKELAEKGVFDIVDTLERDPSIGANLIMAVVDGTAKEMLEQNLGNRGTGTYLYNLIYNNVRRRELPRSNLHLFLFSYFSKGKDPFLPYINLEEDKVNIKGVAIFKDEKVVSYVDDEEMFFFKALMENFKNGSYTFKVEGEYVTIFSLTLKRKYEIEHAMKDPVVHIEVVLDGHIREFSGKVMDPKTIAKIEEKFSELIDEKTEKLLREFQEKAVDPIGIGLLAKTQTKSFDEKAWNEAYKRATFHVNSRVIISETGVVE